MKDHWPLLANSLSRGIMGGDVWMPDLYHRRSTILRIALEMNERGEWTVAQSTHRPLKYDNASPTRRRIQKPLWRESPIYFNGGLCENRMISFPHFIINKLRLSVSLDFWKKSQVSGCESLCRKDVVLKNLNESDDQPAACFTPQLAGSHLQENLHVLQHREPGEDPLLGDGLNTPSFIIC